MVLRPLAGRRVVTTREHRGRLDTLLARTGADVIHVPLIRVQSVDDPRLDNALRSLGAFDWLVVTSHHGAERVGAAAAEHPAVRLGAVGPRTAAALAAAADRPVDVVPDRHTGADLAMAMPRSAGRVLVAQADRADSALVTALSDRGFSVESVTAYRTELLTPTWRECVAIARAHAVAFASGSAVEAWVGAFGPSRSIAAVAIGSSTAAVAEQLGLKIAHTATDHDVEGLAEAMTVALAQRP